MFIAMNRITPLPEYVERFEELFRTRARQVDSMTGFKEAKILRPLEPNQPFIVMTYWDKRADFEEWLKTGEFMRGHARGFEDMHKAREEGKPLPMQSNMELYEVFAD